jgi:hypothetical protein
MEAWTASRKGIHFPTLSNKITPMNEWGMHESGSLLIFSSNGAFAPIFKRSNDLKYHKIMTGALLLYTLFDIGGETKRFWGDLFWPRYAPGGATCLRAKTMVFPLALPWTINLRAISRPIRLLTIDLGCLRSVARWVPSTPTPPLYSTLSLLSVTLSSKFSHPHTNLSPR